MKTYNQYRHTDLFAVNGTDIENLVAIFAHFKAEGFNVHGAGNASAEFGAFYYIVRIGKNGYGLEDVIVDCGGSEVRIVVRHMIREWSKAA